MALVRFVPYARAAIRGCKIDWRGTVEMTDEIRNAIHPQDPGVLRAGRLRRPFHAKAAAAGSRAGRATGPNVILHEKGALVFAFDDVMFLIEAPTEPPAR